MSEHFKKIKQKYFYVALVKSCLVAAFCTLAALGVTLLLDKKQVLSPAAYIYVAVGVLAFLVGFAITFPVTRPTDKKLAKRLDDEYSLKEKVQTMVEFSGKDGEMLRLQREHTDEVLRNIPRKRPSIKEVWQYALIVLVGSAVFSAALVTPSVSVPPINADAYEMSELQEISLKQLIGEVKQSDLKEPTKTSITDSLENLLGEIRTTTQGSAMRTKVIAAVKKVDEAVVTANTYRDIALALNEKRTELNAFTASLTNAAASYMADSKILKIEDVRKRADASEGNIQAALEAYIVPYVESFNEMTTDSEIGVSLAVFCTPFNAALGDAQMQETYKDDALYIAMGELSSGLSDSAYNYQWIPVSALKQNVATAFSAYVVNAAEALLPQVYNCMMDEFIRNNLSEIFGISTNDFPSTDLVLPDNTSGGEGDENDNTNSGGAVEGDVLGKGDLIFDPTDAKYKGYGAVLSSYMSTMLNYINDPELSGQLSADVIEYVRAYFAALQENPDLSTAGGE